jgi:SpoIIAA-like
MASATLAVKPNDGIQGVYFNLPGVAVVKWDPPCKAAHMEWQGWAKPAEFQAANDALIQAIKDHHGSRVPGDSRLIKVIQKSDQDWVNRDWFPRILAAGVTRMALVLPASGLAKMNIDELVSRVADRLDVAYFATLDEARDWLARP